MRKLLFNALCLFVILLNQSCQKELDTELGLEETVSMEKLKVPYGFTWESATDINFTITTSDTRFENLAHLVSVYDKEGKLLSRGSVAHNQDFKTKIYLADTLKEVYIVKTAPDNSKMTKKITVDNVDQTVSFESVSAQANPTLSAKYKANVFAEAIPDCNTGCTQTITSSRNDIDVNANQTICITGSNITVGLRNLNGGTIRICGTNVTVNNANLGGSVTLIVTGTGSAIFPHLNYNSTSATVKNYGTVTVNSSFAIGGIFLNTGTLIPKGDFNLNSTTSSLTNTGTITATSGTTNVGSGGKIINNATMTLKRLQINSNGIFTNNCKLFVQDDFINNNILHNYNYAEVGMATTVNGQARIELYSGSIFQTKNVQTLDGLINGNGTTSLVKVTGATSNDVKQSRTKKVKGPIQYCENATIPAAFFDAGAVQGCDLFIPLSGCNPGNGATVDTDGDGVSDNLDDYPADPEKAFDNYYPSNDPTSGATVAFEDMWPSKGDYDMNDVVVSYWFKIVTSAQNKVVEVNGDYSLYARGGSFHNGFGIEFPVSRSSASNVIGGRLEEGQQKAVIIFFTDMHEEMKDYNTVPLQPVSPPKAYSLSFKVNNGPSLEAFGLGSYNPFIWNNNGGRGRGSEIHLPGKTPTSLADLSLFGTGADDSNPAAGRYYVTKDGFPWAINIPVKKFDYPIEDKDIVTTYLKLPNWVQSGGTQYADWYLNLQGYRNSSNIFSK